MYDEHEEHEEEEEFRLKPETWDQVLDWIEAGRGRDFDWDEILYLDLSLPLVESSEEEVNRRWSFVRFLDAEMLLQEFPVYNDDTPDEVREEIDEMGLTSRELLACVLLTFAMPLITQLAEDAQMSISYMIESGELRRLQPMIVKMARLTRDAGF